MEKLKANLANQDNFDILGFGFICGVCITLYILVLFVYWLIYLKCFRVVTLDMRTGKSERFKSLPKLICNLLILIKYYLNLNGSQKAKRENAKRDPSSLDSDIESFVDRDVEIEEENDDITESRLEIDSVSDEQNSSWNKIENSKFGKHGDRVGPTQNGGRSQIRISKNKTDDSNIYGQQTGNTDINSREVSMQTGRPKTMMSSGDNYDNMMSIPSMDTIQDLRNSLCTKDSQKPISRSEQTSIEEVSSEYKVSSQQFSPQGPNQPNTQEQSLRKPGQLFSPHSEKCDQEARNPSNINPKLSDFSKKKPGISINSKQSSDKKNLLRRNSSDNINDLTYGQSFEKIDVSTKKHIRFASYFGQNLRRLTLLEISLLTIIAAQLVIVTASGAFVFPNYREFIGYLKGDFLYKDYMGLVSMNCLIFGLLTFALSFVLFRTEFKNQQLVYEQVLKNEVRKKDSSVQRKFLSPHVVFLSGLDKGVDKYQVQEELALFVDYNRRNEDSFSSESGSLILADKNSDFTEVSEDKNTFGRAFHRSKGKNQRIRDGTGDISVDRVMFGKSIDRQRHLEDAGTKSLLSSGRKPRAPRFSDSESQTDPSIINKSGFHPKQNTSGYLEDENYSEMGRQLRQEIAGNLGESFQSGGFNDSQMIHIPNKDFDTKEFAEDRYGLGYDRRMQVLLLPDVEQLSTLRRSIETLTRMHAYSKVGKLKCLLKPSEKSRTKYFKQLAKLRDKYQDAMQNIKFSGKALVYLRDLEDVKALYSMNRLGKKFIRGIRHLRKKPKAFKTSVALCKKNFLTDHKDFIFHNLKLSHSSHTLKKAVLYCSILAIFIFISTPNAILQSLAELMKKDKLKKLGWSLNPEDAKVFADIWINLLPLLTLGVNALLLILLDFFAYWQKFPTHSACQKFIFRNSFIYMLINMLLIPGLSLSTANSIYKAFESRDFQLISMLYSLKDKENDSFFSTLIVQSGIVGFLINALLFSDLPNHRFLLHMTLANRRKVNKENYYKTEMQAFQYGYYYASDCVIFFITAVFGIYQPVLYFSSVLYFLFRFSGYFLAISTHYKNEFDSRGQLFSKFIAYIQFAVCLSFFVLSVKSVFVENWDYFLLNTALMVLFGLVALRNFKAFKIKDYCEMRNRFFMEGGIEENEDEEIGDEEEAGQPGRQSGVFDVQNVRAKAQLQRSVIKKFHNLFTDPVLKEVISVMRKRSKSGKLLGVSTFSSRTRETPENNISGLRSRVEGENRNNTTLNADNSYLEGTSINRSVNQHGKKSSLIVSQNQSHLISKKYRRSAQDSLLKIISDKNVNNLMRRNPDNSMLDASFASVNSFDVHFEDTISRIDDIIAKKD